MNDQREHAKCSPAALGCLVDLVSAAFAASNGPATKVDVDDIEQLVQVLHVLRPANADFEFFDGWLHMLRRDWAEAESVYRGLIERSVCMPTARGMLLQCVKARETFGWQEEARKLADEYASHDVGRLAKTLLANDDLQRAYETARRTGTFVAPESTRELEQNAAAHEPRAAAPRALTADDMLMSMQYIRI
jgi:type III secretion protein HrpB1